MPQTCYANSKWCRKVAIGNRELKHTCDRCTSRACERASKHFQRLPSDPGSFAATLEAEPRPPVLVAALGAAFAAGRRSAASLAAVPPSPRDREHDRNGSANACRPRTRTARSMRRTRTKPSRRTPMPAGLTKVGGPWIARQSRMVSSRAVRRSVSPSMSMFQSPQASIWTRPPPRPKAASCSTCSPSSAREPNHPETFSQEAGPCTARTAKTPPSSVPRATPHVFCDALVPPILADHRRWTTRAAAVCSAHKIVRPRHVWNRPSTSSPWTSGGDVSCK